MSAELKLAKAAELEAIAAKLRAEVEAETPKKWEPKEGLFHIVVNSDESIRDFGAVRDNYEQAVKDKSRIRKFNRLLTWLVEQGWDGELEVFQHGTGDLVISFNGSENLSEPLMYGIAYGGIEL